MRHFLTLNNKIILLLFLSVVGVLLAVGVVFSWSLATLQQDSARSQLRQAATRAQIEFAEMRNRLEQGADLLTAEPDLAASVHLISSYQDPDDYQPLVFDPEKESLSELLARVGRNAGYSLVAVYDGRYEPVAFHSRSKEGESNGFVGYENGDRVYRFGDTREPEAGLRALVEDLDRDHVNRAFFRISGQNRLLLETCIPLPSPRGSGEPGGFLRLAYFIDQERLFHLAQRTGAELAISHSDLLLRSGDMLPAPAINSTDGKALLKLSPYGAPEPVWLEGEGESIGFRRAMVWVPLEHGRSLQMTLGIRSELATGLTAYSNAVSLVLPLSGLAVLLFGAIFTRRSVTAPVEDLTRYARRISHGDFSPVPGFSGQDELAQLADAFNIMTTALQQREQDLRAKQQELRGIICHAPAVIYMKDPDGRYMMVNPLFEQLAGKGAEAIEGRTDSELFPEHVAGQFSTNDREVLESGKPSQFEEVIPDGDVMRTYISIKFPVLDDSGAIHGLCGIATDITRRKQAEADLLLAKNVIESANEAILITDTRGVIQGVNNAYVRITGYEREEVLGQRPSITKSGHHDEYFYQRMWEAITTEGRWEGEIWDRRKNGSVYPKWLSINAVRNERGEATHYVGIFSDITAKKQVEEQLQHLAYTDGLTGLPNRVLFQERLSHELTRAHRHHTRLGVLFIDLDRFKYINDTLGHAAGDQLLEIVAERLSKQVRESDTVARLGGDEFTVVVTDAKTTDDVSNVAQGLVEMLRQPITLLEQEIHLGGSIGIAMYPDDGSDYETLTKHADMAMYQAKENGRNNFQFYSAAMNAHVSNRLALEHKLHMALERDELVLHHQPKVELASGRIVGMESLVRWEQPEMGLVSPADFIPLAEETGLIVPMGEWILRQAFRETVALAEASGRPLRVAVNLSARQFQQKALSRTIELALDQSGIDPGCVELELTESMVMGDVEEAIATMMRLRDLGLHLAIDDFGTGYSSLNYLKRFPINTLKIDQSFVRDLTRGSEDAAIVRSVISLGRSLGLNVVAEGVETPEQLEFLREHGCNEAQGYYLSRPLPFDRFEALLREPQLIRA